jgi:Flp pilus assembly protein TadG
MTPWNPLHPRTVKFADRLRQERGQALVEFAVVLPVLMLLVMGIIYFGRYESYSNQMTQLAEVGAREGAVLGASTLPNGATSVATYVQAQATGELSGAGSADVAPLSVRVQCWTTGATPAQTSTCTAGSTTVHVCTQAAVQFPFLSIKTGTISQRASMLVEQTSSALNSSVGTNAPTAANC